MLKALLLALPVSLLGTSCVSIPAASQDDASTSPDDAGVPDAVAPGCEDLDGDGYRPRGCTERVPEDCEEGNAAIHPGAFDDCQTVADEDCNGGPSNCETIVQPLELSIDDTLTSITSVSGVTTFDSSQGFAIASIFSNSVVGGNLLHAGTNQERLIGTHMHQAVYSYEAQSPNVALLAGGRAVYRYSIDWQRVDTGNGANQITGTTTYTFFPDGRMHRSELLAPTGVALPFTTYIALDPGSFTDRLNPSDLNVSIPLAAAKDVTSVLNPNIGSASSASVGRGCAYHNTTGLALSYAWNAYQRQDGLRIRMPQSKFPDEAGHQFAMVLDWRFQSPIPEETYRGAFLLQIGQVANTGPQCGNFDADIAAFRNPPVVDSNSLVTTAEGDSNEDGYVEDGGFYVVDAAGGTSMLVSFNTVGAAISNSHALHVLNTPNAFDPVLFLGDSEIALLHGVDYLLQHEADDSMWIFMNRPVDSDEPLNVVFP